MENRTIRLIDIVGSILFLCVLAAIFVSALGGTRHPITVYCSNNLMQLYRLGTVYSVSHKGEWPDAQGEELWLSFTTMSPPLLDRDCISVLSCPLRDEECGWGETHFRGPRRSPERGKLPDLLGADKVGNHGESYGGNVLLGDGSVKEVEVKSDLWEKAASTLSP